MVSNHSTGGVVQTPVDDDFIRHSDDSGSDHIEVHFAETYCSDSEKLNGCDGLGGNGGEGASFVSNFCAFCLQRLQGSDLPA